MGIIASSFIESSFRLVPVNKQKAQELLQSAEGLDFYLEECYEDKKNSVARQHMTYSANTVSAEEWMMLETVSRIPIPKRFSMDLQTVYLVQLMPTADGGMPHTRPLGNKDAMICYTDPRIILDQKTLTHELWHVHQRLFKKEWEIIFNRLSWKEWDGELPSTLEYSRRYNPDTIDSPLWIYKDVWVPVPVFRDISRPIISDVDIWFYDVKNKYHVKSVPQDLLVFWQGVPSSAYEHPRELTAYLLADPSQKSPALEKLVELLGNTAISI